MSSSSTGPLTTSGTCMQRPYRDGEAWRHDGQRIPALATAAWSYQHPHSINPDSSHEILSKSQDTATAMAASHDHSNIDVATMDRDELQVTNRHHHHHHHHSSQGETKQSL
ncbi:hypothetical protein K440DRAFT_631690, partial [Wilcoxina mikolae CBS 423.85]